MIIMHGEVKLLISNFVTILSLKVRKMNPGIWSLLEAWAGYQETNIEYYIVW